MTVQVIWAVDSYSKRNAMPGVSTESCNHRSSTDMRPYTIHTPGMQRQEVLFHAAPEEAQVTYNVVSAAETRQLQCGPMVKGDFRTANPWSYSVVDSTGLNGRLLSWNPTYQIETTGPIGTTYVSHPDVARAINIAYEKALTELNDGLRGKFDAAVAAAESKKTLQMLNLVNRYSRYVVELRRSFLKEIWERHHRGKRRRSLDRALQNWNDDRRPPFEIRHLRRWQQSVARRFGSENYTPLPVNRGLVSRVSQRGANGWLEFTYGFRPLISDVRGIAENIFGVLGNLLMTFKGIGKHRVDMRELIPGPQNFTGTSTVKGGVKVVLGVQMKPGFDGGKQRWSSINPLVVAYELVPFSFVYDWIVDLGGYMRNLETSLLYQPDFVAGYTSTLVRYRSNTEFNDKYEESGWQHSISASCRYEMTGFTRSLLGNYPYPQLPMLKPELGSSRLLSAAALLRQQLRR